MKRKYFLTTFGCQMNLHDAERISGLLDAGGWVKSVSEEESDAIILLTCCVRSSAERRLYGHLSSLKPLKKHKGITIAVGGCMAQKEGQRLLENVPYVDLVFGTHNFTEIASLLEVAREARICDTGMNGICLSGIPCHYENPYRAWVTITHGCDNFCSYCIVPFVRGREESRPMQEIFKEIEIHVAGGVREVNLLGQNVNSYRYKENGDSAFYELLRCLGERFPETWIRFTTSHPRDFDLETIRSIADTANVCEYVHLPLQAGSNRIIEAMNRGYTAEEYLYKANAIRDMIEDVSLATDIMVGFPGESEDDFQETLEMVESCRFDTSYTFIYNPREGTDAAMVNDNVPKEVKQNRLERLMAITRKLTAESMQNEVGKDKLALVYAPSRKDPQQWTARTRNNKPVHFARTDANISGRIVKVSITAAGNWSLQGAILEVVG